MADFLKALVGDTYQLGYVTSDMAQALDLFRSRFNANHFMEAGPRTLPLKDGRIVTFDMSLAWIGATMIELIHPIAGDVELYASILPAEGFAVRLHHLASPLRGKGAAAAKKAEAARLGIPLLSEIETPLGAGFYLDTYDLLGHYLEYLEPGDPASFYPAIPQNVAGFDPDFWRAYC